MASELAAEQGPIGIYALLACIANPPLPRDRSCDPLVWVQRVQLATTHTIAQLGRDWLGSVRREALYSLLLGPRDWSTAAAILSLARLVRDEEWISPDVGEAFDRLAAARPDSGFWSYESALYHAWVSLPHLFPGEREDLRQIIADS